MKGLASSQAGSFFTSIWRFGRFAVLGSVTLLSGCVAQGTSFLDPVGPIAALQRYHLVQVTLISLIVVLPVLVLVPWLAWRYRAGNKKARYMPDWDFSHALEWAMWGVPIIIVAVLSVILWDYTHKLDPFRPIASAKKPVQVQVVGLDWKWLFIYPQYGVATEGEMAFPQDRPVNLTLTSDTVMQSFMISALGGQIYTMPGMVTKLHLAADHTGRFEGVNTQYSGEGFHDQKFTAIAMAPQDFKAWLAKVRADGLTLDQKAYRTVGARSTPAELYAQMGTKAMPQNVIYFNNVAPDFFKKIVERYTSGKPIPPADQPGAYGFAGNKQASLGK